MTPRESAVVVVGAGPVGLWLACELRLAGVSTVVLERAAERSPHSKALGIHARTIEVLAMRGMEKELVAAGVTMPSWHFGLLESRIDFRSLDSPFPFMLALPQARLEEVFEKHAISLGAQVLRGHAATNVIQDESSVTVEVTGPQGSYTIDARYVAGCDGAGSTVRRTSGIDFAGSDSTTWAYLGDVVLDSPPQLPYSKHSPDGTLIVAPIPGGRFRVTGVDPTRQDGAETTLERLRASTIRVTGTDFGMRDPVWLSRFGSATRLATTYRQGRVFVAGDAAHIHPPAGGVGLNVGI